jgi:hypothetical protein
MEDAHAGGEVADPERRVGQGEQELRPVRQEGLARRGLESLEAYAVELEKAALRADPEQAVGSLRQSSDRARRPVLHRPRGMPVLGEVERLCSQRSAGAARHGEGESDDRPRGAGRSQSASGTRRRTRAHESK